MQDRKRLFQTLTFKFIWLGLLAGVFSFVEAQKIGEGKSGVVLSMMGSTSSISRDQK